MIEFKKFYNTNTYNNENEMNKTRESENNKKWSYSHRKCHCINY